MLPRDKVASYAGTLDFNGGACFTDEQYAAHKCNIDGCCCMLTRHLFQQEVALRFVPRSWYEVVKFHHSLEAVAEPTLILLESQISIDAQEQRLDNCTEADSDAWQRAVRQCEERGLILCSLEEYQEAYLGVLSPPAAYGFTRTRAGCGSSRHVL